MLINSPANTKKGDQALSGKDRAASEAMTKLAQQQQDLIRNGVSPKEIAGQRIIEGEKA